MNSGIVKRFEGSRKALYKCNPLLLLSCDSEEAESWLIIITHISCGLATVSERETCFDGIPMCKSHHISNM